MKLHGAMRAVKIAIFAIVVAGVLGFVIMALWNAVMPGIFPVRPIGFWQALGLLLLAKLLFGGFRPGFGGPGWRWRMIRRWQDMTPEEREKFKHGMRAACPGRRNVAPADAGNPEVPV